MGVVLEAYDASLARVVAVKVLFPESTTEIDRERLLREARACAALESPHVARIFEAGTMVDGGAYMVMERLSGETLDERLAKRRRLSVDEVLTIARGTLEALGEAHRRGLVHRDVKPENLFLHRQGDEEVLKVLDFGLVRTEEGGEALTRTGDGLGTPAYMAPEQIRSAKTVDARADVWSFGVTLYELLTGELPFPSTTTFGVLTRIMTQDPVPVQVRRADVPERLARVIARCLAKEPDARFADANAIAKALAEAEPELRAASALETMETLPMEMQPIPIEAENATPPPPGPRETAPAISPKKSRRAWLVTGVATTFAMVGVALGVRRSGVRRIDLPRASGSSPDLASASASGPAPAPEPVVASASASAPAPRKRAPKR